MSRSAHHGSMTIGVISIRRSRPSMTYYVYENYRCESAGDEVAANLGSSLRMTSGVPLASKVIVIIGRLPA